MKKWNDVYIPLIQQQIQGHVASFGMIGADTTKVLSSSQQKQLDAAFQQGVPTELRSTVWALVLQNQLKISEKLYKILVDRAKVCEENADRDTQFQKHRKVIEVDLHRTYSELNIFRAGAKLHQPLKNILYAFSLLRPDLGYVQGMSYVAGSLLLHVGNELEAFTMFANLMNREDMLFHFYSFDMERVNVYFNLFMKLMQERLPRLHEMFVEHNISCSIFLFEWVVAAFSNIFPLDFSTRIWDNYFYNGDFFILKTALAICLNLEQQLDQQSFENIVVLVKNVREYVDEEALFKSVADIKLTKQTYAKIKRLVESGEEELERLT